MFFGFTCLGRGMKVTLWDAFMYLLSQQIFIVWPRHWAGCRGIYWQTALEDTLDFPSFFRGAAPWLSLNLARFPAGHRTSGHLPLLCPLIPWEASLQPPEKDPTPTPCTSWKALLPLMPCLPLHQEHQAVSSPSLEGLSSSPRRRFVALSWWFPNSHSQHWRWVATKNNQGTPLKYRFSDPAPGLLGIRWLWYEARFGNHCFWSPDYFCLVFSESAGLSLCSFFHHLTILICFLLISPKPYSQVFVISRTEISAYRCTESKGLDFVCL